VARAVPPVAVGRAVSGLGLGGRAAVQQHPVQTGLAQLDQRIVAGGAGRLDRGLDAAAARRDLLVARATQGPLELVLPRAGERQVGVRIDEPRQDGTAGGVDLHAAAPEVDLAPVVTFVADEDDPAVARRQAAVLDDAQVGQRRAATGRLALPGAE